MAIPLRGIQKTTLLDFPGYVACTVFTGGCNFRCPFCHNASLLHGNDGMKEEALSEEAFFAFLSKRRGILDGVCVTGGEPLLHPELPAFLAEIKAMGFLVKLDTNGSNPQGLCRLMDASLVDYVAMDIKNSPAKYAETAGVDENILPKIRESVSLLMEGKTPYEFRTTLVKGMHDEDDMRQIGQWIQGAPRYFLQQFVDSGDVLREGLSAFSPEETRALLAIVREYLPEAQARGI